MELDTSPSTASSAVAPGSVYDPATQGSLTIWNDLPHCCCTETSASPTSVSSGGSSSARRLDTASSTLACQSASRQVRRAIVQFTVLTCARNRARAIYDTVCGDIVVRVAGGHAAVNHCAHATKRRRLLSEVQLLADDAHPRPPERRRAAKAVAWRLPGQSLMKLLNCAAELSCDSTPSQLLTYS